MNPYKEKLDFTDEKCTTCKSYDVTACCISKNCQKAGPVCYRCICKIHDIHSKKCIPKDYFYVEKIRDSYIEKKIESECQNISNCFQKLSKYILDQLDQLNNIKNLSFTCPSDFMVVHGLSEFKKESEEKYFVNEKKIIDLINRYCQEILNNINKKCTEIFPAKQTEVSKSFKFIGELNTLRNYFLPQNSQEIMYLKAKKDILIHSLSFCDGFFDKRVVIISQEEENKSKIVKYKEIKGNESDGNDSEIHFEEPVIVKKGYFSLKIITIGQKVSTLLSCSKTLNDQILKVYKKAKVNEFHEKFANEKSVNFSRREQNFYFPNNYNYRAEQRNQSKFFDSNNLFDCQGMFNRELNDNSERRNFLYNSEPFEGILNKNNSDTFRYCLNPFYEEERKMAESALEGSAEHKDTKKKKEQFVPLNEEFYTVLLGIIYTIN